MNKIVNKIDKSIVEHISESGTIFTIGDIVTCYYKGIYKILGFFDYNYSDYSGSSHHTTQVAVEQLVTETYKKRRKIESCSAFYLRKVDAKQVILEKENELKIIKDFYNNIGLL